VAGPDVEQSHEPTRAPGGRERAILVGVNLDGNRARAEASLLELKELARTAGVEVLDTVMQTRRDPDPRYLIGKGKLEQVVMRAMQLGAELVIFDQDLTPGQARAISDSTELKVIDRTMLILDIFAQRATSSDGRLQVELAQLRYNLPRLVEMDAGLSRLSGGIGGRGPGETKLEIGRRRARDRIIDRIRDGRAPSAILTPISFVLCSTTNTMTP
jgi:GTP-binding protein HflX